MVCMGSVVGGRHCLGRHEWWMLGFYDGLFSSSNDAVGAWWIECLLEAALGYCLVITAACWSFLCYLMDGG